MSFVTDCIQFIQRIPHVRPQRKCAVNTKMCLKEIGLEGMYSMKCGIG